MIINFDPQFVDASKALDNVVHVTDKKEISNEHYISAIGIVVRLGITLDKELLSRFNRLSFVATITTGTDHIDTQYCKKEGIQLISLRGHTEFLKEIHATPEHTWGLLLSVMRKIPWAFDSVQKGIFDRRDFFGRELYKKCFGIIGFGRIGKILAQYAHSFGMDVIVYESKDVEEDRYKVKSVSLEELLKTADIISINLPLNKSTLHFLNEEHFKLMKKNAVLINTSRGAIIDEDALLTALKNNDIAGAALDVLEHESLEQGVSSGHPLIKYARSNQNLLISPHIAGSTIESMEETSFFIVKKIKEFLQQL